MPLAVTGELNKKQYTADGIQTLFPFPYKFFKNTDLQVYIGSGLKTLTTDYSVVGIGGSFANGANVVFNVAPGAGAFITIARVLPVNQPTDYKDYASFPNEQFNADLDRRAMIEQQLLENMNRRLAVHITEAVDFNLELPPSDTWPNQFLGFDAEKRLMVGQPVGAPTTPFAAQLLDDTTVEEMHETLELSESYVPAAGYIPARGDVVELLDDATIRKAVSVGPSNNPSASNITLFQASPIDRTRFILMYFVRNEGYSLAVGTVNLLTLDVTYGGTTFIPQAMVTGPGAVVALSPTLALIAYGPSLGQIVVRTVTITGTALFPNATVNGAAAADVIGLAFISASTAAFVWTTGNTNVTAATIGVSGTVPTINASSVATVSASNIGRIALSQDKSMLCVPISLASTPFTVQLVRFSVVSGNIEGFIGGVLGLGWGNSSVFTPPAASSGPSPAAITVLGAHSLDASASYGELMALYSANLVSNSSGLGKAGIFPFSSSAGGLIVDVDAPNGVYFVVQTALNLDAKRYFRGAFVRKARGANGSYSFGDEALFVFEAGSNDLIVLGGCALSSGVAIGLIGFGQWSTANLCFAMRRRNKILGMATDAFGKVERTGIVSGLSGLIPGAGYFLGLAGNLTTTEYGVGIGQAKTATAIAIQVKEDI